MNYLFFGLFVLSVIMHLYASLIKDRILRGATKPIILLSILAIYIHLAENPAPFVILAISFSWLGDVLLIAKGVKWFALGGVSFFLSHIFFIISYTQNTDLFVNSWYFYLIFGVLFLICSMFVFAKLVKYLPKGIKFPTCLYFLANGTMNCFAIFRFLANKNVFTLLTMIGALLFFISDALMFIVRFNKKSKIKSHFSVMFAYTMGELLIVLGLI